MRTFFKLLVVAAVLGVLLAGFLPPLFTRSKLDSDALNAARAASLDMLNYGTAAQAEAIARRSVAGDSGVILVSVQATQSDDSAQVTVAHNVHTMFSGLSFLKAWFHVTVTQQSTAGS